jgi:hypothetical protein
MLPSEEVTQKSYFRRKVTSHSSVICFDLFKIFWIRKTGIIINVSNKICSVERFDKGKPISKVGAQTRGLCLCKLALHKLALRKLERQPGMPKASLGTQILRIQAGVFC